MIITRRKGFLVVENGAKISTGKLPEKKNSYADLIPFYSKRSNCYYMMTEDKVYRKMINKTKMSMYMKLPGLTFFKFTFPVQFSELHQRLIIERSASRLLFVNLQTKKFEYRQDFPQPDRIANFCLLQPNEDNVLVTTQTGKLLLYGVFFSQGSRRLLSEFDLGEGSGVLVRGLTLTAHSNDQQMVFLQLPNGVRHSEILSSTIVIRIVSGKILDVFGSLGESLGKNESFVSLGFYGCVGKHMLFMGMVRGIVGSIALLDYNTETNRLNELEMKRVKHLLKRPLGFHSLGNEGFYAVGDCGSVAKFSLETN